MTGELIQFDRHREFKRSQLYRRQRVPRGAAGKAQTTGAIELQVARIARLLNELEELTRTSRNVPVATLTQAREGMERARSVIRPWAKRPACREDEADADPQPELDDERLERMYRDLNRDA